MKYGVIALGSVLFSVCYAADGDTYIPLERISIDEHSDKEGHKVVTIKTLFNGGVRAAKQALNISKCELISVHDLPRCRNSLDLPNLTMLNASNNYLGSDDLGTILCTLVQLKTLNMGFNNVTSLATIPQHRHLETLLLNDNKIDTLDVADFFGKLSGLRQGAFHGNKLIGENITNITGSYPSIRELRFDQDAITKRLSGQLIQACPNLTSEICAGSNLVQEHYSVTEQRWDDCNECDECEGSCVFTYTLASISGGVAGLITAGAVALSAKLDFGISCAIFVPATVVLTPLTIRIGQTIRKYCRTKPEDRYVTIPTRHIADEPGLLNLIEDDVEIVTDQEQGQEEDAV